MTGSSTHRNEEGRAYTVLVEQGAQIDEDLPGQTFDIDGEVKTHGIGTEAAWPLAIGCHFRIKKARVDAWAWLAASHAKTNQSRSAEPCQIDLSADGNCDIENHACGVYPAG